MTAEDLRARFAEVAEKRAGVKETLAELDAEAGAVDHDCWRDRLLTMTEMRRLAWVSCETAYEMGSPATSTRRTPSGWPTGW